MFCYICGKTITKKEKYVRHDLYKALKVNTGPKYCHECEKCAEKWRKEQK